MFPAWALSIHVCVEVSTDFFIIAHLFILFIIFQIFKQVLFHSSSETYAFLF